MGKEGEGTSDIGEKTESLDIIRHEQRVEEIRRIEVLEEKTERLRLWSVGYAGTTIGIEERIKQLEELASRGILGEGRMEIVKRIEKLEAKSDGDL